MKKTVNLYMESSIIDNLKDIAYRDRVAFSHIIEIAFRTYLQNDYIKNGVCPQREKDMPGRPVYGRRSS